MRHTKYIKVTVSPTIDTSAYAANDVIGGLLEFDVSDLTVNGGIINSALLVDEDEEGAALALWLFDAVPATIADQAAFAPTFANLLNLRTVVDFSTYAGINGKSYSLVEDINTVFSTSTGKLYGYLVATGTPTYTETTDISIALMIVSE